MDIIKFSSEFDKKKMARICLPIIAITIALLMVVSISTVAAPPSPVSAKIVNSGSKVMKAVGDETGLFVFVKNNKLTPIVGGARDAIEGAFVVTSVTMKIDCPGGPAIRVFMPDGSGLPNPQKWTTHWPQTVCYDGSTITLLNPAVLPGEDIAIFNLRWARGPEAEEPIGKYTFTFYITGTIDGNPVTISAQTAITYK